MHPAILSNSWLRVCALCAFGVALFHLLSPRREEYKAGTRLLDIAARSAIIKYGSNDVAISEVKSVRSFGGLGMSEIRSPQLTAFRKGVCYLPHGQPAPSLLGIRFGRNRNSVVRSAIDRLWLSYRDCLCRGRWKRRERLLY